MRMSKIAESHCWQDGVVGTRLETKPFLGKGFLSLTALASLALWMLASVTPVLKWRIRPLAKLQSHKVSDFQIAEGLSSSWSR